MTSSEAQFEEKKKNHWHKRIKSNLFVMYTMKGFYALTKLH